MGLPSLFHRQVNAINLKRCVVLSQTSYWPTERVINLIVLRVTLDTQARKYTVELSAELRKTSYVLQLIRMILLHLKADGAN